jgi:hypothetical protein
MTEQGLAVVRNDCFSKSHTCLTMETGAIAPGQENIRYVAIIIDGNLWSTQQIIMNN